MLSGRLLIESEVLLGQVRLHEQALQLLVESSVHVNGLVAVWDHQVAG